MEVRVQGLNLAMEALDGCARLGGSKKNLFTIDVVSGHARTIGGAGAVTSSARTDATKLKNETGWGQEEATP